ncbi:MAG TPA: replication initiator [Kribbellaceae bacterium]|nr:replication initiator [Kribbellaceae bacterium]
MTSSTLDITPRTTIWGAVSNTEPAPDYTAAGQAFQRATRPGYHTWLEHVRAAAGCTRPIRLVGRIHTVEAGTGRILGTGDTASMPDGAIYKGCGNRRGTVCPSCAQTYQRDAYQLLRAGLVGGKGVPATVSRHPALFVTLTAPSFGAVHTRTIGRHTCLDRRRCDCRPDPCHARREHGQCERGRPAVCWARHPVGDPLLGQPLCLDCYDYYHHVVWNHHAGELWRRTKQAAERHLATLARRRGIPSVTVYSGGGTPRRVPPVQISHGKAAEFQTRGAVHFHALLRLDGVHPTNPHAVIPPPAGIGVDDLADVIAHAVAQVVFTTPAHPDRPEGWLLRWGEQVDVRPITLTGRGEVTDSMVAGYLAKYATKSTEATGHCSTRLNPDTIGEHADPDGGHVARLINACWHLGSPIHTPTPLRDRLCRPRPATRLRPPWTCPACGTRTRLAACPTCPQPPVVDTHVSPTHSGNPYIGLRRWAHMLGFGGHFLTKARRYSITFRLLRDARITFRRADTTSGPGQAIRTAEHTTEETTLIVGTLTFAGTGWHTLGDALLANTSAAHARARHAAGREELAHETGTTLRTGALPAAA